MDTYRDKIMAFLMKAKDKDIYIFDTETTGIPDKDEKVDIIEFSALKIEKVEGKHMITNFLDIFINPGYPLPQSCIDFNLNAGTGINQETIDNTAFCKKDAVEQIKRFLGDNPLLAGYNSISFDEPLLRKLYNEAGEELNVLDHLDILRMAKEKFPNPAKGKKISHKLSDMVDMLECELDVEFHRSIGDVYATYEVFKKLLPLYKEPEHPEEPHLSIDNFFVLGINPWKQSYQMRRIYIANSLGVKMYYDVYNRLWCIPGHLPEDKVLLLIYNKIGVTSPKEFDKWAIEACA